MYKITSIDVKVRNRGKCR